RTASTHTSFPTRRSSDLMDLLAAEVEEAIAQPLLLGNLLRARHLERQRLGDGQDLDRLDVDFDQSRRKVRVRVLFRAADHLAPHDRKSTRLNSSHQIISY